MTSELLALADRVEAAGIEALLGPTAWQINGDIAETMGLVPEGLYRGQGDAADRWFANVVRRYQAPSFTTSLDAAMSLVPEEASWSLYDIVGKRESVRMHGDGYDVLCAAATAALALTAAALRAHASRVGDGRVGDHG